MLIVGLLLLLLGALVVLAAVFVSEPGVGGQILGFDLTTVGSFLVGLTTGAAILVGVSLVQRGIRRGVAHRRERKELARQNQVLLREQAARDARTVPMVDKRSGDPAAPEQHPPG